MENQSYTPNQGVKVPFDPGWNDPPKLSYTNQQTTPGKPRHLLNKRVAFPLSGGPSSPAPLPANLPPMQQTVLTPSIPSVLPPLNIISSEENLDQVSTLKEVKDILIEFLGQSTELGPKANDIKRRIGVMEEMWLSGKLNGRVMAMMKDLACALRDDKPSIADDIHRALMVDHVSLVGTWMPGVKQLVHHCIARSELLSIDKE